MLIINKYVIATPTPVVATNDANATTGNQSDRWGGINPSAVTGATGNATAGDGLLYISTSTTTIADEVISKLVQVQCTGTFTDAVPNYIKIPLVNVGITGAKVIKGVTILGVFDPNATNTGTTPTPSVIEVVPVTAGICSIVKDAIVIKVAAASIALFQNKLINILVVYSNY